MRPMSPHPIASWIVVAVASVVAETEAVCLLRSPGRPS
jgi:hypothetical protein